jgi:hypothetical protein
MKRQWHIQRTTVTHLNGQQRWDQAYQRLLQWESQLTQAAATCLHPHSLPLLARLLPTYVEISTLDLHALRLPPRS